MVTRTIRTRRTMYEYLDRVLKRLVREIYRLFQSYRTLPFDELNLAPMTRTLYAGLEDINFQAFLEIAQHYYREETGGSGTITAEQLREVLRTPSRVMKYSYDSESVRKRDRLVEALIATAGSKEEIDKAMRYWAQMTGWFAVEVADAAVAQAREDTGVSLVIWRSEHDEKTCSVCHHLDGQVFDADAVPPKPHPGCRCWTEDAT